MKHCIWLLFIAFFLINPLIAEDPSPADPAADDPAVIQPSRQMESELLFADPDQQAEDTDTQSTVWTGISVILALGLVVGVIYLLFFFMKKASGNSFRESDEIRIISTKSLSSSRQLHIIEIGNEISLIAAAENGIFHIKEISDQETIDSLRVAASREPRVPGRGFQQTFAAFLRGGQKSASRNPENSNISTEGSSGTRSFLKSQQERLKKL